MANVVIIGASGFVGKALVKEALQRGHIVKAVARNPGKLDIQDGHLELAAADVGDQTELSALLSGADAVISSYNPGWTNPDIAADTLSGYRSIIDAVKQAGVGRLLVVGGAGSLYLKPGLKVMDSGVIPENILPAVKALAEVYYSYLKAENELDWVFFSPAGTIAPGERTGKFRLGKDDLITDEQGNSTISVEDYAVAMLDELESPRHHKERFTIGY